MGKIADNIRMGCIELPIFLTDVIAAFGDRHGDDSSLGSRHLLDDPLSIVRRKEDVTDRSQDPGPIAFLVALHEGVEAVLSLHRFVDALILREQRNSAQSPAGRAGQVQQIVEIRRLVCPVKSSYADVKDILRQIDPSIPGNRD